MHYSYIQIGYTYKLGLAQAEMLYYICISKQVKRNPLKTEFLPQLIFLTSFLLIDIRKVTLLFLQCKAAAHCDSV